jgi:hypothetical protein
MGKSYKLLLFLLISLGGLSKSFSYFDIKSSTDLSYEKLKQIIEDNQLDTIEKTLELTKKYYPDYFDNYLLMYHSRSLQGSSFEAPRAILFDHSGQFIFSFNGEKNQRGYEQIEIMQYRKDEQKFELREVTFSNSGKAQFSEANPQKCLVCHQNAQRKDIDPRPNWEPYNIWPGAYGSMSGRLGVSQYDRTTMQLKNADPLILKNAEQEEEKLKYFLNEVQPHHSRYQFLNKEKFDTELVVDFTDLITRLAMQRVMRIVTIDKSELYSQIDKTFMGIFKCGKLMVSENAYNWLKNNWSEDEYKAYVPPASINLGGLLNRGEFESSEDYEKYEAEQKKSELVKMKNANQWKYPEVNTSEGFHHLFEPLGISTKDWSLDFKTGGRMAFRERFGTPSNTNIHVRTAFKEVFENKSVAYTCDQLGKESEKQFDDFMNSQKFKELVKNNKKYETRETFVLSRCVKCHESGDYFIPQINFSNPQLLKEELKEQSSLSSRKLIDEIKYRLGDYAREDERMPLGPMISDQQRHDFVKYINQIAEDSVER